MNEPEKVREINYGKQEMEGRDCDSILNLRICVNRTFFAHNAFSFFSMLSGTRIYDPRKGPHLQKTMNATKKIYRCYYEIYFIR